MSEGRRDRANIYPLEICILIFCASNYLGRGKSDTTITKVKTMTAEVRSVCQAMVIRCPKKTEEGFGELLGERSDENEDKKGDHQGKVKHPGKDNQVPKEGFG